MKIVIDISNEDYAETIYKSEYSPSEMDWADRIISDGILLEKVFEDIKADIKSYESDCLLLEDRPICKECNDTMFGSIYKIIDKHIGKEQV